MNPGRLLLACSVAGALATALGSATVSAQSHRDDVALRIRAYRHRAVDQAIVRQAQAVANDLLAAAGILVAWRICETSESCGLEERTASEVVVSFSARGGRPGAATVAPQRLAATSPKARSSSRCHVWPRPLAGSRGISAETQCSRRSTTETSSAPSLRTRSATCSA
jgi:hypothetical protein